MPIRCRKSLEKELVSLYFTCRAHLRLRGIQDRIARKGIERNDRLGRHRWVVERIHAWLAAFGNPFKGACAIANSSVESQRLATAVADARWSGAERRGEGGGADEHAL